MDIHEKVKRVKKHLAENKAVYLTGAICLTAGAGVGLAVSPKAIPIVDSFKITLLSFSWKSPTTNITTTIVEARADRGHIVKVLETDQKYGSINAAADALGVSRTRVRKHLAGLYENVNGLHLTDLGENLGQAV